MGITPAQKKILAAVPLSKLRNKKEYVSEDNLYKELGRCPHPNTLDALVRCGLLVKNPFVKWSEYKLADDIS
jgi:hypothetical protein